MKNTTAVFPTVEAAHAAIADIRALGLDESHVRMVGNEAHVRETDIVGDANNTGEVSSTGEPVEGALKGAGIGAGAGLALGLVALAIPPLAGAAAIAVASGAIVGAASGGIGEVLQGVAYTSDQVAFYESELQKGGVLIAVDNDGMDVSDETLHEIYEKHGGRRGA